MDAFQPTLTDTPFMRGVDRWRWVLFAAVALLYLAAFNGQLRVTDDNSLYMRIGINLAEGRGYTYLGEPDTVAFPGLPLIVALGHAVSAAHGVLITHVLLLAMGAGTLVASYWLFREHGSRSTAVLSVVVLACFRIMHEHSFRLLTDGPFAFGVVLSLLGYALVTRGLGVDRRRQEPTNQAEAPWWGWGILAAGLAIAVISRVMMMALALSLGVVCLWRAARGPGRGRHVLVGLLVLAVLVGFYLLDPRRPPEGYLQARTYESGLVRTLSDPGPVIYHALTRSVPELFTEAAPSSTFGVDFDPITATVLGIAALTLLFIGSRGRMLWRVFVVVNILVILMFLPSRRQFLPLLPVAAFGFAFGFQWLGASPAKPWNRLLPAAAMALLLAPNVVKTVDLIIEQRSSPFLEHYRGGKYASVQRMGETIAKHVEPKALVLADHPGHLTLFSDGRRVRCGRGLRKRRDLQQVYDYLVAHPRVYVVDPMPPDVAELAESFAFEVGPPIAEVRDRADGTAAGAPRWTLHVVTGMSPPALPDGGAAP
ncbi:MAG: phospholipid carrier-dependent glycosyltransferase [Planctomycetota bacterium]|jgi:4-amino-4-deoxy-L-arabinose transferase-like glycosyltransferase